MRKIATINYWLPFGIFIVEIEEVYRRDLNLLVALRVLIEESSVTEAANRLNLSQSAMSRILGRLREMLDDPLFIREGQNLLPTEKAIETDKMFSEPLGQLCRLLSPIEFEPIHCEKKFVVATTDYAMQTILPYALPRIYNEAPNVSFEFIPLQQHKLAEQLGYGSADLAICRPDEPLDILHSEELGKVGVMCLLSKQHELANRDLTLEDYLNFPHAQIAISSGVQALIDQALSNGPQPRVVLSAYHLETALAIVDTIPLIINVPADLAYLVAKRYDLVVKELPFELPFNYSMIWHPRCDHSASQDWLRNVFKEEFSRLIAQRVADIGIG